MRRCFGNRTKKSGAVAELRVIRQQKGDNVRTYSARFTRLLGYLPTYDGAWALDQYTSGLVPRVAELLLLKAPRSIEEAVVEAENVEVILKYPQHTCTGDAANRTTQSAPANQDNRGGWRGRRQRGGGQNTGPGVGGQRTGNNDVSGSSQQAIGGNPFTCY